LFPSLFGTETLELDPSAKDLSVLVEWDVSLLRSKTVLVTFFVLNAGTILSNLKQKLAEA
jgi:hypothetical protein